MSETAETAPKAPRFEVHKLYLKNTSLEAPNSPALFQEQWTPEINIQLANMAEAISDGVYEVALRVTVTAKAGEKTAFLVEVEHAGVFTITDMEPAQLGHMHGAFCPTILFPYIRETIDSLLVKAGFSPLQLAPINFDMLYAQRLEQTKVEGNA